VKKNKWIIPLCVFFCLNSAGCTDKKEVDDQVYAIAIGADKGVENKIRFTVQYPTYRGEKGSSQQSGDSKSLIVGNTIISTVEAPSILEALNLFATFTSRRISLVHAKMIIFSEDFAREGIAGFIQPIARFRETRRIMQIVVCKGSAEDFIKENTTLIGVGISKAVELKERQSMDTGFFPRTPFHDFYRNLLSPYSQPYTIYAGINDFTNLKSVPKNSESPLKTEYGYLPGTIPRAGDLKIELVGTAVFNGDRMIGSLNSYETRYFQMITGDFKRGIMTIEDKNAPGKAIVLDLRPGRSPKVEAHFEEGRIVINVKLNIEADIGSIQSRYPYEEPQKIDSLNNQLKERIEQGVKKTIKKSQEEFQSDIFGFGYKVAKNFSTTKEFEKYNWLSHYSEASVNVDVETNVRRTGLMIRSAKIRYNDSMIDSSDKE
jgi:spore germination protein KC